MIDLQTAPIGTAHRTATCCWCGAALVVGAVLNLRAWLCPTDYPRQIQHALIAAKKGGERLYLDIPLPSQVLIEEITARNILWGGQAGPGKSHGIRKWLYRRSLRVPHHEALLLRENNEQLEKTHMRAMARELEAIGGKFVDRTARFPNGSVIDCGHMADDTAVTRYRSTNYGAIVAEEGSLYPRGSDGATTLAELSTRAREEYTDLRGQRVEPKFIVPTNPGGDSAEWLAQMFIDHLPDYDKFPALAEINPLTGTPNYDPAQWAYVPARLDDNPYMREDYATTDLAVLSGVRYQQLRKGDWRVFVGQFFRQWISDHHVTDLEPSRDGLWFRSLDWGKNKPGCVLWWTVLPDHHLYIRKELKFQDLNAPDVAAEILKIDRELHLSRVAYTVADPSIVNETGQSHQANGFVGESIGETLGYYGVPIIKGDNNRPNGWGRCHALLRSDADGIPWLRVHADCRYLIRTIAAAKSDKKDADDVDTNSDDHALDAWRYGAMSRPSPIQKSKPVVIPIGSPAWHMQQLRQPAGRRLGQVA